MNLIRSLNPAVTAIDSQVFSKLKTSYNIVGGRLSIQSLFVLLLQLVATCPTRQGQQLSSSLLLSHCKCHRRICRSFFLTYHIDSSVPQKTNKMFLRASLVTVLITCFTLVVTIGATDSNVGDIDEQPVQPFSNLLESVGYDSDSGPSVSLLTSNTGPWLLYNLPVYESNPSKRALPPAFTPWAGKRSENGKRVFHSWAGKRSGSGQPFGNWAGKRSLLAIN